MTYVNFIRKLKCNYSLYMEPFDGGGCDQDQSLQMEILEHSIVH
jgi:hypothetical protein